MWLWNVPLLVWKDFLLLLLNRDWDTPVDVIHTYNSPTDTHLRTEPWSRFPLKAISGSDTLPPFIWHSSFSRHRDVVQTPHECVNYSQYISRIITDYSSCQRMCVHVADSDNIWVTVNHSVEVLSHRLANKAVTRFDFGRWHTSSVFITSVCFMFTSVLHYILCLEVDVWCII